MQLCFHPSKDKSCHNTVFPPAKLGTSVAVKVIMTCLFTASSMHNLHTTYTGLAKKKVDLTVLKFQHIGKVHK